MKKVKFKVFSLGCKVNQYDAGKLSAELSSSGFIEVENGADLVIINTCAVTASAITKSRQTVALAKRENPGSKIVLAGCWPRTYRQQAEVVKGVDLVLAKSGTKEILMAASELYGFTPEFEARFSISRNLGREGRYFLKIQDGCEQFCSYCVIPYARGPLTSRPSQEVLSEARLAVDSGFSEIVLSGIHLGLYGVEHVDKGRSEKGMNLCKLIEQLSSVDGLERIRLSSIEITEVSDELIDCFKFNAKLCHHLHIPLQSGCDKVLKAMKRPYDTAFFAKRLQKVLASVPDMAFTTDVIVGFPGETKADFNETFSFISRAGFCRLHVFPFSAHALTEAASLPNKVSEQEKRDRSARLRNLSEKLSKEHRSAYVGRVLDVVVESFKGGRFRGRSGNYIEIDFSRADILSDNSNKKGLIGETVKVKMKK